MKKNNRTCLALLAAIAGLPIIASSAWGQIRVNTDGHALDANTQVGSGGYNQNSGNGSMYSQNFANSVVTGNVTAGQQFRGAHRDGVDFGAGYTDPFAFRGLTAGQGVDQFVANSTGVPTMTDPNASSIHVTQGAQTFYGQSNHSAPPPGFAALPNGPGYIPAQPMTRSPNDYQLGVYNFDNNSTQQYLPRPGEIVLPGPVDPSASNANNTTQFFSASSLYGVRQWDNGQSPDLFNQGNSQTGPNGMVAPNAAQTRLQELRGELLQNGSGTSTSTNNIGNQPNGQTTPTGAVLLPPLRPGTANTSNGQPLSPLTGGSSGTQLKNTSISPSAGDVSTSQTNRVYINDAGLPPPGAQSREYVILQDRLQKYQSSAPKTDEEANRQFKEIMRLRNQAKSTLPGIPGTPGAAPGLPPAPNPTPGVLPPETPPGNKLMPPGGELPPIPGPSTLPSATDQVPTPPPANREAPVQIDSFATGIKAPGLAKMLDQGDSLVKQGQFDKAISVYNDSVAVAPNNPLIRLGRANAELAGGYYRQADDDFHAAFGQDQAVLMGQYDLTRHFGAAKVSSLEADLQKMADSSPANPTPAFLLAYMNYNTHHEGQAADWLDKADQRSGGKDQAIQMMKRYWNFNETSPATQP